MRQITLIVTFAFVSLFTFLIASLATTDTLKDDFKDPRLTKELWEIKKGDWEIKDGWWESNSPAVGQGSFVLFSDIETHDNLAIRVKCRDKGGGWSNCYTIFAYVDDDEVYYAGARIGRGNWTIEKSALAGGEQNFGEVADGRVKAGGVIIPYTVSIEGKDVVIYDEKDKEVNRHSFGKMPIGRIGLAHENTITQYNDFEVEGPKVKGLSVQPLGKLAVTWARIKKRL
ncbi:MAG TPA: hypothetical protein EYN51_12410 [Flavobacteriales bacterium]|nr:hypothetical protein [Flavobacteriales bacterium]